MKDTYKLYIVTYKNRLDLINNLNSVTNSDFINFRHEIFIINNSPEFDSLIDLEDRFKRNHLKILQNILRPGISTGHLARNWNQAIVNGFKDLNNPDSPVVIHCQDDVIFEPNWFSYSLELLDKFNFLNFGVGDALTLYKTQAIHNIGLWDERFCGIGLQEADYFTRAYIYNKDYSCINDIAHKRLLNPVDGNYFNDTFAERHGGTKKIMYVPGKNNQRDIEHKKSAHCAHDICRSLFYSKYKNANECAWPNDYQPILQDKQYILYPYFERNIQSLRKIYK